MAYFFATHDPTTQDRQGNDVGRQYASVIFYSDEALQKPDRVIAELRDQQGMNLVTEVHPAQVFYAAEAYHQNFMPITLPKAIATLLFRQNLPSSSTILVGLWLTVAIFNGSRSL